ncbi:unnamed protein product [Brachionus calyciflorus]|uniref:Uncharacterized protein n=1 Tax=Brachionus calyciflorus TaxID=104777 RepID=A0A814PV45_9BILA|nr:unnamed protein product [Brachionus calyciflorus]
MFLKSRQYFRSLSIEINSLINRLKEKWNLLTIVLNETKYFEFKNLIVFYELEFKKITDTYYKSLSCSSPEAIVPSSTAKCINRNYDRSSESISIPINYKLIKRTVLTSEKSTSTINNESTQTEFMYDTIIQSDGKKFLLEAYLRNNNLSSSHHKNKSESCTGIARESGIGTANDDESLSLTDIEKQCDDDYKHNLSFETFPFDSSKRYLRRKLNNLKSNSTISTSSSSKLDEKNNNQKNKSKKSTKEQIKYSNKSQKHKEFLFNNFFKKIVNFLIIFLIPCFFILLFFAFILYRSYVNQNCCDYKRNHLFINLT